MSLINWLCNSEGKYDRKTIKICIFGMNTNLNQ